MKSKHKKTLSVAIIGALTVSAICYTDHHQNSIIEPAGTLTAGITSEVTATVNRQVLAGVSLAVMPNVINLTTADVTDTDIQPTAAGVSEEDHTICGYTNLGIANVEGNLNVRKEASVDSEIVGKMQGNAGCEILGVEGDWTLIQSGKVNGFVSSEYLITGEQAVALAEEIKTTVAKVITTTLNVRKEPNTECAIIALVGNGEELEILETLDGWYKVAVDDEEGYISSEYVEVSTELPKAQTMTEIKYGQGVSDVRVSMVSYACQFVGNPYVWGGTSLTRGADCSGFVLSVYAKYGISLPHSSRAQANCGTRVSASNAKPGDLFFYGGGRGINHVAIYIGNGQIVHASNPRSGIKISNAYYRSPVCVVRILNE